MRHIPLQHFKEHIPNEVDVEVRVNHTECPAGEDTRGRLFIRRRHDGVVLAYCHNCSGKAFIASPRKDVRNLYGSLSLLDDTEHDPSLSKDKNGNTIIAMPEDASSNLLEDWSGEAVAWVTQYGITPEEIEGYGVCYSPSLNKVLLPVHTLAGGDMIQVGYQARRLEGAESGVPKYITYVPRKYKGSTCFMAYGPMVSPSTLVLVEDALSAIKVSRYHDSIAVLTATVSPDVMAFAAITSYSRVVVALDNDNPTVRVNAGKAVKQLRAWGVEAELTTCEADPKELSDEELQAL